MTDCRTFQRATRDGPTVVIGEGATRDEFQRTGAWLAVDVDAVADLAGWR